MSKFFVEPEKKIPVCADFDVVVAGGGIAGVAAAVAAARNGASTCLLEKEYALGGLATLGLVIAYLPLCDGKGKQVSFGLAEEMLLLSTLDGTAAVPDCWLKGGSTEERKNKRYFLEYNAASYMLELENFVRESGVTLLYDVRCAGVVRKEDSIEAVIVETKRGREAITCRAVVDATGDADICYQAREETLSLNTNSASGWYYSDGTKGTRLHKLFKPFDPEGKILPEGTDRGYSGDSAEEVTAHLFESRQMIREHIAKQQGLFPQDKIYPFMIPTFPGFRMTRRLSAEVDMQAEDGVVYPDSVGLIGDWRCRGPVYSIPLRAIRGVKNKNLFAAGRCISSTGYGWDQTRVIPACAVSGEAAGMAAAILARQKDFDYQQLHDCLCRQGVRTSL